MILLPHILALPYERPYEFLNADGSPRFDHRVDKPRDPNFVLFGPTYVPPRKEFQFIESGLDKLGKLAKGHTSKPADGPWRLVTTDGVVLQTWSLENPDSVRAVDLDAAAVVEAGVCPADANEKIRGRVAARRGFIIWSGTIEESRKWWRDWLIEGQHPNHKGIKSYSIPSWANRFEFPLGENDPEILAWKSFLGEELFMERCAAVARPTRFRVLREIGVEHIQDVEPPEDATYEVWIDPGYASAYAILLVATWAEEHEGEKRRRFHFVDELYEQLKNTDDMITLCETWPQWRSITDGVIDISAKTHRDATQSALEIWKAKTHIRRWHYHMWPEDRLRERIAISANNNQFTISPKCAGMIAECGLGEPVFPEMHPWRFPHDRDGRIVGEKPEDKWNHSLKAAGYGLLHHLGVVERMRTTPKAYNRMRRPKSPFLEDVYASPARR